MKRGRTKIGCISGPKSDPAVGRERVEGVKDALQEAGLSTSLPTEVSPFDMEGGKAAMQRLLSAHPDLDGVFCATDAMAQGALIALKEAGRTVPRDVSVVAVGNDWANLVSEPQLTTAELFQTLCGKDAASLLLEAIEQGADANCSRQIRLGYKIIERGSV